MKEEIVYKCKYIGYGFIAKKQTNPCYVDFTDNIEDAKIYKTKQGAARTLDFRKWNSDYALQVLEFFEYTQSRIETLLLIEK